MKKGLLAGIGVGAGLMYLLDPETGKGRRRRLRDRGDRAYRRTGDAIERASDTVVHEARELRGRFRENAEMIRGRPESAHIIRRILTGAAGGALLFYGLRRRGVLGTGLGTVGASMLAFGVTSPNIASGVRRIRERIGPVRTRKTVHVNAPVEQVFGLWSNPERLNEFIPNLESVERTGAGRMKWTIRGRDDEKVEIEALTAEWKPNERIVWKSAPDAKAFVEMQVDFRPGGAGTDVRMRVEMRPGLVTSRPAVILFLGRDPAEMVTEGLYRMKAIAEGHAPAGAGMMRTATATTGRGIS